MHIAQGFVVDVKPSTFDENLDRSDYKNHGEYVTDLAAHKVNEVMEKLSMEDKKSKILCIGADTIVTKSDKLYGKPRSKEEAFNMLSECVSLNFFIELIIFQKNFLKLLICADCSLSGTTHTVYTGVCIKTAEKEVRFWESTDVTFGKISPEQINAYIETGEYS